VSKIKLLLLDIDGVMTDGRIYISDSGEEIKAFHVRDGTGIRQAQNAGIRVGFVTSRYCEAVVHRANELGVEDVYQGATDKSVVYRELKEKYELSDDQICYVGDDLQDLELLKMAGIGCAVADAADEAKEVADLITETPGGRGAVREVVRMILKQPES
jgi:3-deoxy-D-manno-octulosonate 8-phosphate phosphatase (KDO 8-P phosphatase)